MPHSNSPAEYVVLTATDDDDGEDDEEQNSYGPADNAAGYVSVPNNAVDDDNTNCDVEQAGNHHLERIDFMMGRGEAPPSYDIIEDSMYESTDDNNSGFESLPEYREGNALLYHKWFEFRRNAVDETPARVASIKQHFRTIGVALQVVTSILVVLAFLSNSWISNLDRPPSPSDPAWWTSQEGVARPATAGLFRQCGSETIGCAFVQPGVSVVKYASGRLEIGIAPRHLEAIWRTLQALIMTTLFIQLLKFKIVFAYVRFRTEWVTARVAILLRYACCIISAILTVMVFLSFSVFVLLYHLLGVGSVGSGAIMMGVTLPLCTLETFCWVMGLVHFTCSFELDRLPGSDEEYEAIQMADDTSGMVSSVPPAPQRRVQPTGDINSVTLPVFF